MGRSLLRSEVNSFVALVFVGTCALCAALVIWNAAFGENPLANAFLTVTPQEY